MATLYDLNKDMLIKLLSVIQENTIKDYQEKMRNEPLYTQECDICDRNFLNTHDWVFNDGNIICKHCTKELSEGETVSEIRDRYLNDLYNKKLKEWENNDL